MISPSRAAGIGEQFGGRLVMRVLADLDQHRLDAERREDVAIGGIAGHGERDPIAGLERGEKGELERRRRAGCDDNLGGIDRDAVLRRGSAPAIASRSGAMPSASV